MSDLTSSTDDWLRLKRSKRRRSTTDEEGAVEGSGAVKKHVFGEEEVIAILDAGAQYGKV